MNFARRFLARRAKARRERELIRLNLKFFGYAMARRLAASLPVRTNLPPQTIALESKAATQADLESDWVAYWAVELKIPVFFHRKLWELAYILQALHQNDMMRSGARGLGFGCGIEPIPSYLASQGADVTVTDLSPEQSRARGWQDTNQHISLLEQAHHPHLVSSEIFKARVNLQFVEMNAIPDTLRNYDFNWSTCALEHLGSIANGLRFLENCLATLRPGGLSVHTTEFNFLDDKKTVDHWDTVLFQRAHFVRLQERLQALGHVVAPLNFDVGDKPLDRFIDLPPYVHHWAAPVQELWGKDPNHIKMAFDGFACTSFGIMIRKAA